MTKAVSTAWSVIASRTACPADASCPRWLVKRSQMPSGAKSVSRSLTRSSMTASKPIRATNAAAEMSESRIPRGTVLLPNAFVARLSCGNCRSARVVEGSVCVPRGSPAPASRPRTKSAGAVTKMHVRPIRRRAARVPSCDTHLPTISAGLFTNLRCGVPLWHARDRRVLATPRAKHSANSVLPPSPWSEPASWHTHCPSQLRRRGCALCVIAFRTHLNARVDTRVGGTS